jgi:hypothetical protein
MTFKNYLISKRNAIIVLLCLNSFALLVNMLSIKGVYDDANCPEKLYHYFWSSGSFKNDALTKQNFWPFVEFYEFYDFSSECNGVSKKKFMGIFRFYDFSEFIVYFLLMILFFYIRWETLRKVDFVPSYSIRIESNVPAIVLNGLNPIGPTPIKLVKSAFLNRELIISDGKGGIKKILIKSSDRIIKVQF